LFVKPRPVHSSQCFAHRIQTPGSAKRNSQISQTRARVASRLVRPPCAPRRSARRHTLRVYESPARECRATKSRRHAAIARAAQTHQIAVAELQRRHRFAERQHKLVVRIRAPENPGRCDCASACCSSAVSQGVRLAGRPRCRATQQRAPPTRGGQAVAAAGHLARCRTAASASASGTHNWSQSFVAVLVLTTRCHSASCRTLGTLAHYSYTHCCNMYVPCRSSFSLPFLDD
jgi:hypothetical protein